MGANLPKTGFGGDSETPKIYCLLAIQLAVSRIRKSKKCVRGWR